MEKGKISRARDCGRGAFKHDGHNFSYAFLQATGGRDDWREVIVRLRLATRCEK